MTRWRHSADFDSIIVCTRTAGTKNSNSRDAMKTGIGLNGARAILRAHFRLTCFLRRLVCLMPGATAEMRWRCGNIFCLEPMACIEALELACRMLPRSERNDVRKVASQRRCCTDARGILFAKRGLPRK